MRFIKGAIIGILSGCVMLAFPLAVKEMMEELKKGSKEKD